MAIALLVSWHAGEVRLTLKVDPLDGEITAANNEMSTYLTVSKEGLSVLLVDKARYPEPQLICDALRQDPRIRLFPVWLRRNEPPETDLLQLEKRHYDVIILGDVSAKQVAGNKPEILRAINALVADKRTGLLMMGGYASFGNSDWRGTAIDKLLPVGLDVDGQIDRPVKIEPTEAGLRHYIINIGGTASENKRLWEQLPELTGMTRLGQPRGIATLYARSAAGDPILVGQTYGKGRVLAFAGDTTYRWRRNRCCCPRSRAPPASIGSLPGTSR